MSERYTPEQMDARAAYEEKHLTSLELDADESCNCEECKFERDERDGIAMLRQAAQDARDLTDLALNMGAIEDMAVAFVALHPEAAEDGIRAAFTSLRDVLCERLAKETTDV